MQDPRAIAVVERLGRPGIAAVGAMGVGLALLAIPAFTTLVADVALIVAGLASMGAAGWAWATRSRLLSLPLELAPIAGRGVVDGAVIYRFRARLGHGRALRDPDVQVAWVPADGEPVDLTVLVPARSVCGPFTLVVRDDLGIVDQGTLTVRVSVRSGGRTWQAEASYPVAEISRGRFVHEPWNTLQPEE